MPGPAITPDDLPVLPVPRVTGAAFGAARVIRARGERRRSAPTGRAGQVAEVDVRPPGENVALRRPALNHDIHGKRAGPVWATAPPG